MIQNRCYGVTSVAPFLRKCSYNWYNWQRECVRKELEDGTYLLDTDVEIDIQVNLDGICMIGTGHLTHSLDGFRFCILWVCSENCPYIE